MRYKVFRYGDGAWGLQDTKTGDVLVTIKETFPDAEFNVRSQALFMNESPACQQ